MIAPSYNDPVMGSHQGFTPTYSRKIKLPGVNDIVPVPKRTSLQQHQQQHQQHQQQHQQQQQQQHYHTQYHEPKPSYFCTPPNMSIMMAGSSPERPDSSSPVNLYTRYPISPSTNRSSPISIASSTPSVNHGGIFKPSPKQSNRQSNAWGYEDDLLLRYLKEVRNLGWREISTHFVNRTANGCQFRWRRINALSKTTNSNIIILNEKPSPVSCMTPNYQQIPVYSHQHQYVAQPPQPHHPHPHPQHQAQPHTVIEPHPHFFQEYHSYSSYGPSMSHAADRAAFVPKQEQRANSLNLLLN